MQRLAIKTALPIEVQQICNTLMDMEGLCTCGRIMRRLDAKLILMTAVPSKGQILVGAYCLPCSGQINRTLKGLRSVMYSGTETAPVDGKIKTIS